MCTGNLPNAGTDAKVHLMLVGQRGDTGYRQMLKRASTKSSRPFQPRQVNTTLQTCVYFIISFFFHLTYMMSPRVVVFVVETSEEDNFATSRNFALEMVNLGMHLNS